MCIILYSLCFNWRMKKWISYCLCLQRICKGDKHVKLCIPTMIIITLRTYVFEDVLIILSATKGPNRRVRKDLALEVMLSCCCCSVAQSYLTLCYPLDCSMPGLPVRHQLPEFTQTHGHWVSDAIQPSRPLSSPSPPAFNLSQHQGLFQWVSNSHQMVKILEVQL